MIAFNKHCLHVNFYFFHIVRDRNKEGEREGREGAKISVHNGDEGYIIPTYQALYPMIIIKPQIEVSWNFDIL